MKYIQYVDPSFNIPVKRVESCFIEILGGHLVIEEKAWCAAAIIKEPGQRINYGNLNVGTLTREKLIDLRMCIDTVLNEFEKNKTQ